MGAINTFGSILPILSGIAGTVTALDRTFKTLGNLGDGPGDSLAAEQKLAMKQLQQRQKIQEQQLTQQAGIERERLSLQATQDDESRRQALRRAVARQRAQFGASGIGAGAGSSEAVLLGLFEESDDERAQREQMDTLRRSAIGLDVSQNRSLNLLQATQLAQRQNLARLF